MVEFVYCARCKVQEVDFSRSKRCCSICLDKYLAYSKKYKQSHKDLIKEISHKCYEKNKDKYNERQKIYDKKNEETIKKWRKQYYKENKQKIQITQKKCVEKNKDHYNAKKRERWNNKYKYTEKSFKYSTERRARVLNASGSFTKDEFDKIKERFGNRCLCCGRCDVKLEADHIIPISMGGSNSIDNIQPLCRSCNAKKFKSAIDYRQKPLIIEYLRY